MYQHQSYDFLFKLFLIGDSGIGKTCMMFRFCNDFFQTAFIPTIGIDFRIKTVLLRNKRIKLQIWDTAGQERFDTMTTSCYRGAMGIILVYDITNYTSFNNIPKWLKAIQEHANEDVEKMLIGNRSDKEDERVIPKERGEVIAKENNILFFETSAKTGVNIDYAFAKFVQNGKRGFKRCQFSGYWVLRTTRLHKTQKPSSDPNYILGFN